METTLNKNLEKYSENTDSTSLVFDSTYVRKPLADMLPLSTPLGIDFHPTTYCNIKCIFCLHSSTNPIYDKIKNNIMPFETVKKAIDEMKDFPEKIKAVHFCGLGEPLLHKDIAKMISYAKSSKSIEKVDLNTGAKIDFEKYVKNIQYLFENRKNTKIYIKILSFMVDTQEKKDFFYKTFEPLCDVINIEYYNECFKDTKGKDFLADTDLSQRGEILEEQKVCSQPFFKMEIKPNGDIATCAEAISPVIIGNVNETPLSKLWQNKKHSAFCLKMLNGREEANPICRECTFIKVCNFSSDSLDNDAERLKQYYVHK